MGVRVLAVEVLVLCTACMGVLLLLLLFWLLAGDTLLLLLLSLLLLLWLFWLLLLVSLCAPFASLLGFDGCCAIAGRKAFWLFGAKIKESSWAGMDA